jgi:hypothetical protein
MAQVVGALNTYSTCLMDLLPSMEETLYYVTHIKLPKQHSLPARFKASRLAHTYVRGISEQFEMADSRLLERLGEANLQRRIALLLRKIHMQNMKSTAARGSKLELPIEMREPPESAFVPVSMSVESASRSHILEPPNYSAIAGSYTSYIPRLEKKEDSPFRLPPICEEVSKGIPFTCDICGHRLSDIKDHMDWMYARALLD